MDCPKCSTNVGGVGLVVGVVKITTFHCKCGRVWRTKGLMQTFSLALFVGEIERLSANFPSDKPLPVKITLAFLQAKVDEHHRSSLGAEKAFKRRREDHWDREFLKNVLGEDY